MLIEWEKCFITFNFTRKGKSFALNQHLQDDVQGELLHFESPYALMEHSEGLFSRIFKTTNFQHSLLPQELLWLLHYTICGPYQQRFLKYINPIKFNDWIFVISLRADPYNLIQPLRELNGKGSAALSTYINSHETSGSAFYPCSASNGNWSQIMV